MSMKKILLVLLLFSFFCLNALVAANLQINDVCNYLNNEITIRFNAGNGLVADAVVQAQAEATLIRQQHGNFLNSFNSMDRSVALLLQNKSQLRQYYILVGNQLNDSFEDIGNATVALLITFSNLGEAPIVTLAPGANGMQTLDGSNYVAGTRLKFPLPLSPPTNSFAKALFVPALQL